MTMQRPDPFIWNNEEWIFLGAENVYTLFDPESFGLSPTMADTACYKGFVIKFVVSDKQIFLDKLEVYCANGLYPPINGINPKSIKTGYMRGYRIYENINLPLHYSGIITIGRNLHESFRGRAFIGPHAYENTFELIFKNGTIVKQKDTSGTYKGF